MNTPTTRELQDRAIREFEDFLNDWTPPACRSQFGDSYNAARRVRDAIRAIAPDPDTLPLIGQAVFKAERDRDYDRERPSGFIHTMISAVFETTTQALNAYRSRVKRGDGHYILCEIREIPMDQRQRPIHLDRQGATA